MKAGMKRLLVFLRLVDDHDSNISLTNVALIVVISKLIFVPHPTVFDLGTLLLALANYNAKKLLMPEPCGPMTAQAKVEVAQAMTLMGKL